MRRIGIARSCGTALLLLLAVGARAWSYDSYPMVQGFVPDARGGGMGRAFTAVAEGPSAIWWNPGGLGLVRGWWVAPLSVAPSSSPFADVKFRAYGICGPVGRGGLAAHYGRLTLHDSSTLDETESALAIGYGLDLAEVLRGEPDPRFRWGVGGSVKRLAIHTPNTVNPAWEDLSAWDVDLGTLVRLERTLARLPVLPIITTSPQPRASFVAGRSGVALANALDRKIGPNDSPLGREIRMGLGVESGLIATPPFDHLLRTLATLEVEHSFTRKELGNNVKFGVEATLLGIVTWRYGEFDDHYRFQTGSGQEMRVESRNARGVTQGVGVRLGGERASVSFDYARTRRGTVDAKLYTVSAHWVPRPSRDRGISFDEKGLIKRRFL